MHKEQRQRHVQNISWGGRKKSCQRQITGEREETVNESMKEAVLWQDTDIRLGKWHHFVSV